MSEELKHSIRHYIRLFVYPVMLVSVVLIAYLPAMKTPSPHEVDIAIAGPEEMVVPMVEALQSGVGDMYTVSALTDAAAARQQVEDRHIAAALVLSATADDRASGAEYQNAVPVAADLIDHSLVIYVATAGGPAITTGGLVPLQQMAAQMGAPVMVRDLVPLGQNDLAGNGQMWFTLAVTMGAYVGVTMLSTVARDLLNLRTLIVALPIYGLVLGLVATTLTSFVFPSVWSHLPLLLLVSVLNVTAVGLGGACICRFAGGLSTLVVMFVFMGLGMTSSGASIPVQFVPAFYRYLNPIMPYGATSRSVRDIIYFDNAGLWQNYLTLGIWVVVMGAALWAIERWRGVPSMAPTEVTHFDSQPAMAV